MVLYLLCFIGLAASHIENPDCAAPSTDASDSTTTLLNSGLTALIRSLVLQKRIPTADLRYKTLDETVRLLLQRNARVVLETGSTDLREAECFRDGCSTQIFSNYAKLVNGKLYAVEANGPKANRARDTVRDYRNAVEVIEGQLEPFLSSFAHKADLLYLHPSVSTEKVLAEVEVAYGKVHDNSIIVFDGAKKSDQGKAVLEFLKDEGWTLHMEGAQMIFLR